MKREVGIYVSFLTQRLIEIGLGRKSIRWTENLVKDIKNSLSTAMH